MTDIGMLMDAMRDVLESLLEGPKTDSELLGTIPNFSLELLGALRTFDAIDHNGHLIYVTSRGERILKNVRLKT
jgi:hypothetical protein